MKKDERFFQWQTFSHALFDARLDTGPLAKYPQIFALKNEKMEILSVRDICLIRKGFAHFPN